MKTIVCRGISEEVLDRTADEILYSRYLRDRDSDDLRELLERHRESLTLFIFGFVHDMDDAEELMLNAFAVAASGTSRFSGRSSFKTWLFAIGRNLARKHLRSSGYAHELNDAVEDPESMEAENELIKSEDKRELYAALSRLPEDYRNVLYLLYFEDMSTEQAAAVMKKTKKQVYNLAFRGKQQLKELLTEAGFDDEKYR